MQIQQITSLEDVYSALKQDVSLKKKLPYSHPKKTKGRSINMSIGRQWFNMLLPDDFRIIDEIMNKEKIDDIIPEILRKYGTLETSKIISKMQKEAFKLASILPSSFNIDALIMPDEWSKKKKNFEKEASKLSKIEFQEKATELTKELIDHLDKNNMNINYVLKGGIKGDPIADWRNLLVAKGYVLDIEGNVKGPITKGINDGYDQKEFYIAAAEARRGFYYKSTMTYKPGYLSRKITTANAGIVIDDSKIDCGTKKYLELKVTKDLSKILTARYYKEGRELINVTSPKSIIGKTIKLRSPLYCIANKGICPICYGDLYKLLNSKKVGMMAGGAVNMVAVNAMMKIRHKSSQVDIKKVNFNDLLKKSSIDLKIVSLFFDIKETKVYSKNDNITIILDENDYNLETTLINYGEYYSTPGIIEVMISSPPETEYITFPFNFKVKLNKPDDFSKEGKLITMKYKIGELIFYQETYSDEMDPSTIDRLFEGGAKYITNPETLLMVMNKNLSTIDLTHLELIISNMFRDANDLTIPCRLTNYQNFKIIGQKKLPFITSWLSSLAFENINKALKTGLISGKDAQYDPIEKVVLEKFDNNSKQ